MNGEQGCRTGGPCDPTAGSLERHLDVLALHLVQSGQAGGGCGIAGGRPAIESVGHLDHGPGGQDAGELRPQSCGPLARLLVSSLLARAFWCAHPDTIDARIAGTCTRVVAETLDVLLPAIMLTRPSAPIGADTGGPP
jgi:hypothetical protein